MMFCRRPALCIAVVCLVFPALASGRVDALLRANSSSQLIQNQYADRIGLSRMRNVSMIQRFCRKGYLVRVPRSTRYYYLHQISSKYRYVRPWTKLFLDRLSRQHYAKFGRRLRVTSLVRTVALQESLDRTNGNAAAAHGELSSSHLTGATIDISKHGMTAEEVEWMRRIIYSLREQGYLYGIEEFEQPVFHVMVYRRYADFVKRESRVGSRETRVARREKQGVKR